MRRSILVSAAALALSVGVPLCVSMLSHQAAAQPAETYVNVEVADVKPAEKAKFVELVKKYGAAAVKEPGCREANFVESKADPNHIVMFEVYDNEAAFNAHRAGDNFKQYEAAASGVVERSTPRGQTVIGLYSKGH